jgi:hypothetical protein
MTADEKTKLEIALGCDQPLPWAETIRQEIELEEMRLADPIRDHVPRSAPARKVRGVLSILDQLDRNTNPNRRFND